jgi:hypothetical protein
MVRDLYALDRIWKDIGTYRNQDYIAPNKAKVGFLPPADKVFSISSVSCSVAFRNGKFDNTLSFKYQLFKHSQYGVTTFVTKKSSI